MQKLFDEVASLDKICYESLGLSEEILMEHAALGVAHYIREHFARGARVLIAIGGGHNGADGWVLARQLYGEYDVACWHIVPPQSAIAQMQHRRCLALGVPLIDTPHEKYDVVVDALLGSGQNRALDTSMQAIVATLNRIEGRKIALDMPTGLLIDGGVSAQLFQADVTLTMGALKKALFSEAAKPYVGAIEVVDLGIARGLYEGDTQSYLLERSDAKLPWRSDVTAHKGTYGHLAVVAGEMTGAAQLAALAGLRMGAGLVTVVSREAIAALPLSLMQSAMLPAKTTAMAIGMGLGAMDERVLSILALDRPKLLDADILYMPTMAHFLIASTIITPHPKEFCALLATTQIATIDVSTLQANRMHYVDAFMAAFPEVVLVLKGANVIIAQGSMRYINAMGSARLAKGGSGDVLAGLISALLAQGYAPIDAAITGSIVHTSVASSIERHDYALTPIDIIDAIGKV